jgi:hypothetical protein
LIVRVAQTTPVYLVRAFNAETLEEPFTHGGGRKVYVPNYDHGVNVYELLR